MGKRLWDLAKSRIEIGTILLGHRHIVRFCAPSTDALRQGGDGAGWLGSSAGGLRLATLCC